MIFCDRAGQPIPQKRAFTAAFLGRCLLPGTFLYCEVLYAQAFQIFKNKY